MKKLIGVSASVSEPTLTPPSLCHVCPNPPFLNHINLPEDYQLRCFDMNCKNKKFNYSQKRGKNEQNETHYPNYYFIAWQV